MEACTLEASNINKKRIEGLKQRVCLPIELSDPGRILSLMRSLFENSSDILQMKINKYLAEVTGSVASFMVMSFLRKHEHKVTVISERILPLDLHICEESETVQAMEEADKCVEISKELLDEKLKMAIENHIVELEKQKHIVVELSGLLSVPIKHPVNEKTLLHVVLVNPRRIVDYKRICTGLVNEAMRYCVGTLVNAVCFEEEKKDHEYARCFMEIIRETLVNIEGTQDMISEIRLRICDLMQAERCTIFLRDECGNFITNILNYGEHTELAEQPLKNIKLPPDYGLVAIVARTGGVVNCDDPQTDPRYCIDLDIKSGRTTRNVLCFALKKENDVIGAVEVYNKVTTRQGHNFTEADEQAALALSSILAPLIMHSLNFKKIKENDEREYLSDAVYLQKAQPTEEEIDEVLKCELLHDYHNMLHLNFSQFNLPESHLACLIYEFFRKFGLIRKFEMNHETLVRFILTILKDHPAFPFHNWRQTLASFHFATVLTNELNLVNEGICTHIEVLSLLMASLCHMSDFRGALSIFQVSCGTTLGGLYSTPAHINQQFQSSQIFRLLHRPETNIVENIPTDQYNVFLHLLKKLISVADMGCFMEKFPAMEESLKNVLQKDDLDQRLHLLSLLMGCSVLNDYSKDFNHCRKVAELTYCEFMPALETPNAHGVFDLKEFAPNIELIPHLQIQFISTICLPTFRILSEVFPVTYPCLDRCQSNLLTWEKYKDKFQDLIELEKQTEFLIQTEITEQPQE